jgi:hypothetical protein
VTYLVDFYSEAWAYSGFALIAVLGIIYLVPHFRARVLKIDRRIWSIILTTFVATSLTLIVLALGILRNPSNFFGAVFASWVGSVAFFLVVGAVAAVVAIAKPEEDTFEARARILFRGKTGQHVEYAIARIKDRFEHYADEAQWNIVAKDYDENTKCFYISEKFTTKVRSYIDDVDTLYKSSIEYSEMTEAPPGRPKNRLVFAKIGGEQKGGHENIGAEFALPFETKIARSSVCDVIYQVDVWVKAQEEQNQQSLKRYTRKADLVIENHLPRNMPLTVSFTCASSAKECQVTIAHGSSLVVVSEQEIQPDVMIFDFRLLLP